MAYTFESSTQTDNHQNQITLLDQIKKLKDKYLQLTNQKAKAYKEKKRLLPTQRLHALLDDPQVFLPIGELAGAHLNSLTDLGGGQLAGIGLVSGKWVMIQVYNSAIKGGIMTPTGVKKTLRLQTIAATQRLPFISLVESAGADLTQQADLFIDAGSTFANQARLSAAGIPSIAIVHGTATAGGAYVAGLSDITIMVEQQAHVFLAGPPLVKAATGQDDNAEDLGGCQMHARLSGLCDLIAKDDYDAIEQARALVATLPWPDAQVPSIPDSYLPNILKSIPKDFREPSECFPIIQQLIDTDQWIEFKPKYGSTTVVGFAEIGTHKVGVISNQGPIDQAGAEKTCQFIQLCCVQNRPLIFLQNTTGFMVGKQQEQRGIIKYGSRMIQAVTNAPVAKITIHIGASFGAGNYAMCSRSLNPDFVFAWPNNRLSVMGGNQAAKVMEIIGANSQKGSQLIDQYETESSAIYCSGRLWDDGIIDPRETRWVLILCLNIIKSRSNIALQSNHFGVMR